MLILFLNLLLTTNSIVYSSGYFIPDKQGRGIKDLLEYIGHHLVVHFTIINKNEHVQVELTNAGPQPIPSRKWSIVLCYHYRSRPRTPTSLSLADGKFVLQHLEADIFRLSPNVTFRGLGSREKVEIVLGPIFSASCIFPNWFVDIDYQKFYSNRSILYYK